MAQPEPSIRTICTDLRSIWTKYIEGELTGKKNNFQVLQYEVSPLLDQLDAAVRTNEKIDEELIESLLENRTGKDALTLVPTIIDRMQKSHCKYNTSICEVEAVILGILERSPEAQLERAQVLLAEAKEKLSQKEKELYAAQDEFIRRGAEVDRIQQMIADSATAEKEAKKQQLAAKKAELLAQLAAVEAEEEQL
jgi:hypothetical protein